MLGVLVALALSLTLSLAGIILVSISSSSASTTPSSGPSSSSTSAYTKGSHSCKEGFGIGPCRELSAECVFHRIAIRMTRHRSRHCCNRLIEDWLG